MKTNLIIPSLLGYLAKADFGNFDQVVSTVRKKAWNIYDKNQLSYRFDKYFNFSFPDDQLAKLNQTMNIGRSSGVFRDLANTRNSMQLQVLHKYRN